MYKYNLRGLLKIRSDIELLQYKYFEYINNESYGKIIYDISIYVRSNININSDKSISMGWYRGEYHKKWVMYHRKLFGMNLIMLLKNLEGATEIKVSPIHASLFKLNIGDIPDLYTLIDSIQGVKLLMHDYTPLHSSCLLIKDELTLFVAFSNVGKTTTVLKGIRQPYVKFLSEDLTIIGKNAIAYGIPTTMPQSNPFLRKISQIVPLLPLYFKRFFIKDVKELIPDEKILDSGRVTKLFFLERGSTSIEKIDNYVAFRKLICINRENYNYSRNRLLRVYEYFNPSFELNKLLKKEEELLKDLALKSECYILRAPSSEKFFDIVSRFIKSS